MKNRKALPKWLREDYNYIENLIEYARENIGFERGVNIRLRQLADVAKTYLETLVFIPINTGELVDSLHIEEEFEMHGSYRYLKVIKISFEAEYAKYVEFGTGIVGEQSSHKLAGEVGWDYDINSHGLSGWSYVDKQGKYHHTLGQPPSAFLYKTYLMLKALAESNPTTKKWYEVTFETDEENNPFVSIYKR